MAIIKPRWCKLYVRGGLLSLFQREGRDECWPIQQVAALDLGCLARVVAMWTLKPSMIILSIFWGQKKRKKKDKGKFS
jgi:hypothetical protein